MRNVTRPAAPESLRRNSARWTRELMGEISRNEGVASEARYKYFGKYGKDDVRDALKSMYNNLCCYCESRVGKSGDIEHRLPKRKYPASTYDWNNLHLSCRDCNTAKSEKFDEINPILDPVIDFPISNFIKHKLHKVAAIHARGKTTIRHTKLDRDDLNSNRQKISVLALEIIEEINEKLEDPGIDYGINQLEEMISGEYGSMIEHLVSRFGKWGRNA